MARHCASIVLAFWLVSCGSAATPQPETRPKEVSSPESNPSKPKREPGEVSQWSEVPQNEPASSRSVIGKRKARVIVVSNPASHGEALHFQFVVNSVAISGVFSAPGGQSSTFTLPTGSVRATLDECRGDPVYFELGVDDKVTLNCELTTEGDCCELASPDNHER